MRAFILCVGPDRPIVLGLGPLVAPLWRVGGGNMRNGSMSAQQLNRNPATDAGMALLQTARLFSQAVFLFLPPRDQRPFFVIEMPVALFHPPPPPVG